MSEKGETLAADFQREIEDTFRDVLMALEAQYIDWSKFNHGPDHDPDYKPEFPEVVKRGNELLMRLRSTKQPLPSEPSPKSL